MKKMILIIAAAAVAALAVFLYVRSQTPTIPADARITSFYYSHSGSSTFEMYSYEIGTDEESGGTVVSYELNNGNETYALPADAELMRQLSELVDGHELRKWNGFDKSNSFVMDGSGFYLEIDFSDETKISAYGSNSFPKGHGEAEDAINDLFHGYLKRNGIDPKGGF